ncbi:TrkH family potassium uptake protein [Hyphobacterium marinum]|uniref:Trk system potassium uptake protein n=1 Tax=Hyphobacterium marinum TaxID=3116574 RepID=A0ABU7LWH3_9PROT|nr:TrkH family potassium uptake protein [Hyphobacterium sp. Y6023]MEE2565869.1 TrkH family potassium uptake protein [Hyphobacterium sp. Y6023]
MIRSARPVFLVLGIMIAALSVAMLVPFWLDAADGNVDSARAFLICALTGTALGGALSLATRGEATNLSARAGFVLTGGSWAVLAVVAAIPLRFAGLELDWTNAFFEAMSGLTTTGATVLTGLDDMPRGVLMWRAILQWIGGIGIIVTAMAVWPLLGVGGMQLFRLESSDNSEKILPRAAEIAAALSVIYLVLTLACAICYGIVGLNTFDAIAHAMTTVATGGYSTRDASLGAFLNEGADLVALVFMLLSALPFVLYLLAARGKPGPLFADPQVRGFFALVIAAVAILTIVLMVTGVHGPEAAWRFAAFNAVSIITGTGYASTDFAVWGPATQAAFFVLMFAGGCAGSTTCSIKIFRYQIALLAIRRYILTLVHPHAIAPMNYGGKAVPDATVYSVLGFLFAFIAVFIISAAILGAMGLDTVTALSGAAATLGNVGPGLGHIIGPAGTFAPLPDAAKWVMTANMLIGRLEVLTVLVFLTPRFWRS